jgi:hypothetical protein
MPRKTVFKNGTFSQVLVAHACNPNYSRGRDQEDLSLKPTRQIVWETLFKNRAVGVAQDKGPEFKPQ